MKQFNVMHVVRPAEGGLRTHVRQLIRYADRERFNLLAACPDMTGMVEEFHLAGAAVWPVELAGEAHPLRDWRAVRDLRNLMREQGVHLVHAHGAKAGLVTALAAEQGGRPLVVVTMHNFVGDSAVPGWQKTIFRRLNRYLAGSTDRLIAVSRSLAGDLEASGRVHREQVSVIPNGIDLTRFQGVVDCGRKRAELGLHPTFPVVGVVARMIPQKGVDLFLQAAVLISKEIPNIRFLVVGDGPRRAALESQAQNLGIAHLTVFAGWRDDVPGLLPVINVLVIPSTSEGQSITALEAMAARRPVVAFAVGGLAEVIRGGETGLLVPAGDVHQLAAGVVETLRFPLRAERMGRRARQAVEADYDVQLMVQRTQEVYLELLGCRDRSTANCLEDKETGASVAEAEAEVEAKAKAKAKAAFSQAVRPSDQQV